MGIALALKFNGRSVFSTNPGRYLGATSFQAGNFIKGGMNSRSAGAFSSRFSGYPNGALAPNAYVLPMKNGSISSYTRATARLSKVSSTLVPTMPLAANSSFALTVTNAQLDQVIQLIANGVLALTGSASIAAAVSAAATSSFSLTGIGQIGGIVPISASSSISLSPNVIMTAKAYMIAEAGGPTPLSPEGLAAALLNAILADYNDAGSVGEALNNVGAGSNPWSSALAANNDAGSFGAQIQKLLTKSQFIALKD